MKNYNISADFLRILAAFYVIYSHSTDRFVLYTTLKGSLAWHVIYYINTLSRVAVPLFIILSGYLLLNNEKIKSLKTFYQRRFSRVFFPFIIWLIIYYGWTVFWDQTILTPQFIWKTLWHGDIWHLYFLIIILELYLITPILKSYSKTKKQQTILFLSLLALSIISSLLVIYQINLRRLSLTMFIPYIGIYYAGSYLRDFKITKLLTFVFFALYLVLALITNLVANGNMTTSFIVFNYSPTLLSMTLFLFLAGKDFHKILHLNFSERFKKIVSFIGRTTFGIYLLHFLVLDLVWKYFHLLPWELHAPLILWACVPAFITFAICLAVISLIRLLPYSKYFVG